MHLQFERVCRCRKLPNFCLENEAAHVGYNTLEAGAFESGWACVVLPCRVVSCPPQDHTGKEQSVCALGSWPGPALGLLFPQTLSSYL